MRLIYCIATRPVVAHTWRVSKLHIGKRHSIHSITVGTYVSEVSTLDQSLIDSSSLTHADDTCRSRWSTCY